MQSPYLSLICCVVIVIFIQRLLRAIDGDSTTSSKLKATAAEGQLAQTEGSSARETSVLEHIEHGAEKDEHSAVVCLFQPREHLANILCEAKREDDKAVAALARDALIEQKGLWQPRGPHQDLEKRQANVSNHRLERDLPDCLTLSYSQLHRTSTFLAAGLLANGAAPRSTIVMFVPNGGEFALLLYASVLLRATYVCLDPALLSIAGYSRLKQFLQILKPQVIVTSGEPGGSEAVDTAVDELNLAYPVNVSLGHHAERQEVGQWTSFESVISTGKTAVNKGVVDDRALVEAAREDDPSRIHSVMFTSGTSGMPKGCPIRVGGMSYALQSQAWLFQPEGESETSPAAAQRALMQPHNSRGIAPAQTLQTWRAGGAIVMTGQNFSAEDAVSAIVRAKASFLVLTPPMVHEIAMALAACPGLDVTCVKSVQIGGDTVTRSLLEQCEMLFPSARIFINHGMTEGPGAFMWPEKFSRMAKSELPYYAQLVCPVGRAAPGAAIRVYTLNDAKARRLCARGQLGEMHVSCPSIIQHYWNGRSESSFYADEAGGRWFKSGDVAMIDQHGTVFVVGRKQDIIWRAGRPVMPAPLESLLQSFLETQVRGQPAGLLPRLLN